MEGAGHPHRHHPLGLPAGGALALPVAEVVEHLPDPGVVRRALEVGESRGAGEGATHDPLDPQHLAEEDDPVRPHGVQPLGNLENGGRLGIDGLWDGGLGFGPACHVR